MCAMRQISRPEAPRFALCELGAVASRADEERMMGLAKTAATNASTVRLIGRSAAGKTRTALNAAPARDAAVNLNRPSTLNEVGDDEPGDNENHRKRQEPGPPAVSCDEHIDLPCELGRLRSGHALSIYLGARTDSRCPHTRWSRAREECGRRSRRNGRPF